MLWGWHHHREFFICPWSMNWAKNIQISQFLLELLWCTSESCLGESKNCPIQCSCSFVHSVVWIPQILKNNGTFGLLSDNKHSCQTTKGNQWHSSLTCLDLNSLIWFITKPLNIQCWITFVNGLLKWQEHSINKTSELVISSLTVLCQVIQSVYFVSYYLDAKNFLLFYPLLWGK